MMLAEVRNSEEYIIYIGWLAAPVGGVSSVWGHVRGTRRQQYSYFTVNKISRLVLSWLDSGQ